MKRIQFIWTIVASQYDNMPLVGSIRDNFRDDYDPDFARQEYYEGQDYDEGFMPRSIADDAGDAPEYEGKNELNIFWAKIPVTECHT